jgi:hypothetical protein
MPRENSSKNELEMIRNYASSKPGIASEQPPIRDPAAKHWRPG